MKCLFLCSYIFFENLTYIKSYLESMSVILSIFIYLLLFLIYLM